MHPLGESGFASGSLTDRLQRLLDRKARSSLRLSAAAQLIPTPNSSCRGHRTPVRPKGVDLGALLRNTHTPTTAQLHTTPAFRDPPIWRYMYTYTFNFHSSTENALTFSYIMHNCILEDVRLLLIFYVYEYIYKYSYVNTYKLTFICRGTNGRA